MPCKTFYYVMIMWWRWQVTESSLMFQTRRSVRAYLYCPDGSSEVGHHQAEWEEGAGGGVWAGRASGDRGGPDWVQADHHRDGHQVKYLNRGRDSNRGKGEWGGGYLQERRDHNKEGGKESQSQGYLSSMREQSQKHGSLSGRGGVKNLGH